MFYVWAQERGAPTVAHSDFNKAQAEAMRVSSREKITVLVLEVVGRAVPVTQSVWHDGDDPLQGYVVR